jgi:hypothetical protein
MNEIIEILMRRDGLSETEAIEAYFECKKAMEDAIAGGAYFEVDEILRSELGLEPDYIFNFI